MTLTKEQKNEMTRELELRLAREELAEAYFENIKKLEASPHPMKTLSEINGKGEHELPPVSRDDINLDGMFNDSAKQPKFAPFIYQEDINEITTATLDRVKSQNNERIKVDIPGGEIPYEIFADSHRKQAWPDIVPSVSFDMPLHKQDVPLPETENYYDKLPVWEGLYFEGNISDGFEGFYENEKDDSNEMEL